MDLAASASTPLPAAARILPPEGGRIVLPVRGMSCAACAGRVERALTALPGVEAAVDLVRAQAVVTFDPARLSVSDLTAAVRAGGYDVALEPRDLAIGGMHCAGCVGRIERALLQVPGVVGAAVNLASGRARVEGVAGAVRAADLLAAVDRAGYAAEILTGDRAAARARERTAAAAARREGLLVMAALLLAAPLAAEMVLPWFGLSLALPPWLQAGLATPVQFLLGGGFYVAAYKGLKARAGTMDLLVVLGTSAAYFYSLGQMLAGGPPGAPLYFSASAIVVALVLAGRWLEARARRATGTALAALTALRPERARVLREGTEFEVPVELVAAGDRLVVRPGERLAADGFVLEGMSEVDESLLTGESLPVVKRPGDAVTGGAINGNGRLLIEAGRVGGDSRLARIIALVESAQGAKAPVQRLVDRVAGIFVPVVILVAAATFLAWWLLLGAALSSALAAAVAVLVIACPCALGLATPAAIVVGIGRAARAGILIRDAETLGLARQIDWVVLDKTGTLTEGRPAVTDIIPSAGMDAAALLELAVALQSGSEHPLARAIMAHVGLAHSGRMPPLSAVSGFASRPGRGIVATIAGARYALGNRRLLVEAGVEKEIAAFDEAAARLEAEGKSVMRLARLDPAPAALGLIAVADPVKPTAAAAVMRLRARGIGVMLATGDNARVAAAVGLQAGIGRIEAEMLPEDKAERIKVLQAAGHRVAMVGDGVNDAPALAQADVGMAMGTGTDVAMASAGITLMRGDPLLIADAIAIARATHAKIAQNLFWAFAYNVVCIPLAAAGLLNPVIAGAAMAFSSVSVVANALLLRRWRPAERSEAAIPESGSKA